MAFYNIISVACMATIAYKFVKNVRRMALFIFSETPDLAQYGKWAVITGGAYGIGREFSNEIASQGINIIFIGYEVEQVLLDFTASYIRLKYNVQTKCCFTNLCDAHGVYSKLEKELANYEIGVLVNATALNYNFLDFFIDKSQTDKSQRHHVSNKSYTRIIRSNLYPVTHLSRIVLKQMYQRKRGVIINVSSTISEIPTPMLAVYGAAKTYISKFTRDISSEYSKHGIIIQCWQPGFVTKNPKPFLSWLHPTPKDYVVCAIKKIGLTNQTCGFIPHSVLLVFVKIMGVLWPEQTRNVIYRMLHSKRGRAIKQ